MPPIMTEFIKNKQTKNISLVLFSWGKIKYSEFLIAIFLTVIINMSLLCCILQLSIYEMEAIN